MSTTDNSNAAALKTRQWLTRLGFVLTGVIAIGLATYQMATYQPKASKPIAGETLRQLSTVLPQDAPDLPWAWHMDQSKWPRVLVPAHGDSIHVPSFFGGHIVWGGSGFKVHYVYSDGHECVIGDAGPSCGDGNIVGGYAHNEGEAPLYASYAYARKDEK